MTKKNEIATKELGQLIDEARLSCLSIRENIANLGAVLGEIGRRYGAEGLDMAVEALGLSKTLARNCIACSRGTIHPAVALGMVAHAKKLEALSYDEQKEIIEKGLTVVEKSGNSYKSKKVPLDRASKSQIAQVFDGNKVRPEQDQYELVKNKPDSASVPTRTWEIKDGKFIIHRACQFTVREAMAAMAAV